GHVCAVMGTWQYEPIAQQYGVPIVATGFEPVDILQGVAMCIEQLEHGRGEVEIQYTRCVQPEGNRVALAQIDKVFCTVPRKWRGIGEIPESGWALRRDFARFDAAARFGVEGIRADEPAICLAGAVLQGHKRPFECPAFGRECTPETPLGAPMVSSEGACSAYYRYRLHELKQAGGRRDSREGES
ncbi:MAG: hydrogenase formation protein HypD, partial [Pirellulaceae bacterium]|nr:hydrogenase formation protein HypD [Pirellulaceae bacterium]